MAFTTRRGRPRNRPPEHDPGTPELRMKHALSLTAEPIDLCLERQIITPDQHRSALHLRWLYTLRYGAPSLTTHYGDRVYGEPNPTNDQWRAMRELEYLEAVALLKQSRCYEPVMRLCVFSETPAFLAGYMRKRCWDTPSLTAELSRAQERVTEGLSFLVALWHRPRHFKANTL